MAADSASRHANWWYCENLPPAEARWLAGTDGPLSAAGGPGVIERLTDGVRLDKMAVRALSALPDGDGRVEWDDLVPVLRFGQDAWPLVRKSSQ